MIKMKHGKPVWPVTTANKKVAGCTKSPPSRQFMFDTVAHLSRYPTVNHPHLHPPEWFGGIAAFGRSPTYFSLRALGPANLISLLRAKVGEITFSFERASTEKK